MGLENLIAFGQAQNEDHIGEALGHMRAAEKLMEREPVLAKQLLASAIHALTPSTGSNGAANVESIAENVMYRDLDYMRRHGVMEELGILANKSFR